jgi:predicted metal-dependent enzyme (double-stranded beta helix superfamily)
LSQAAGLGEPNAICAEVRDALIDLASNEASAIPAEYFEESKESYARRLFYRCPDSVFSAMIMVWGRGQGTQIHDHAGKWCVECVLRGRIEIVAYDPSGDPSTDDVVTLTKAETTIAKVGDVGVLVPPNEYHQIRNAGDETAVTMHVYAGEMLWCHTFQPLDEGGFRRERCDLCLD